MGQTIAGFYEFAVIAIFVIWFALSIALQFRPSWLMKVKQHDYLALLPCWTFFAPHPATSDVHLLFRDRVAESGMTYWREVPMQTSSLRAFWSPEKRARKTLKDLESGLLELRNENLGREGIFMSLPYLMLINYVAGLPRSNLSISTQFALVRSWGYLAETKPVIIFLSELHATG